MKFLSSKAVPIYHGIALVWFSFSLSLSLPAQPFAPVDLGTSVNGFQDDFTNPTLNSNWKVRGQNVYSVANGILHIGNATGDPNHLLYEGAGASNVVQEVLARMRVTQFGSGSVYSRGGLGVGVDVTTSQGIDYTFRDASSEGFNGTHTAFLDDFRAWGPGQGFAWQPNVWYWLRVRQEPNAPSQGGSFDVFGKIWPADGTIAEPVGWQLKWDYTPGRTTRGGFAGLMAGSTSGSPSDYSQFDVDYVLIKSAGLPSIVVAPVGFIQIPVSITNPPSNQTVAELAPATFSVGAGGVPAPVYQWFRNNTPIVAATNAVITIASALTSDNGAIFRVVASNVVSNVLHSATSSDVTLTVLADTTPPALLGARSAGLGSVQAVFSELIAPASVVNLAHYVITGTNGSLAISNAVLDGTQTNLLLTVSPMIENATYTITVNGLHDLAQGSNLVTSASANFVALQPSVWITEFMADNATSITDSDGEPSDWIEFQNQSPFSVDLGGWKLTDDPANMGLWTFPSTVLAPGQFLVVFASGKDRRTPGAQLHTNFRLDASGEYLALSRPDTSIAHGFSFGHQRQDISYGLTHPAGGLVTTNLFMTASTPGQGNAAGVLGFVSDTKCNPGRGIYATNFSLSITSGTSAAEIWFSTDGGVPSPGAPGSTKYINPIPIANTTTLRTAAFLAGYAPTDVDTHTYIFVKSAAQQPANPSGFPTSWAGAAADYEMDPEVVNNSQPGYDITNALLSLPAISLTAPRDDLFGATRGIYYNSGQQGDAWEREGSIELIFPDGTPGFQAEAGLRIHGYTSRQHSFTPKHSIRVSFRNRFGPAKLHYPLLPDAGVNDFDQLVLRACSTDSYCAAEFGGRWEVRRATYMRDQWVRDALRDLGELTAHGRYVHLWLNGLYWGMYNLTEALGNGFAAQHLGGDKDQYDVIKDYLLVDHGNQQAWDAAINLATTGFSSETDYQLIQGNNPNGTRNTNYPVYLNMTNLADYMLVHITASAEDWDFNNWWTCRRQGPASAGFHFCSWDQEVSNDSLTRDVTVFGFRYEETATPNRPSYFYDRLRQTSPSFRQLFMDRAWFALSANGPLAPTQNAARWLTRQNEIDRAIVAETARWGDARREPPYTRESNWVPEMQWEANFWANNHTRVIARLQRVSLWPLLGPPTANRASGYFTNSLLLSLAHTNSVGTIWFTLDGTDPRAATGAPSTSAANYSGPLPLNSSTRLRARVLNAGNWSAPFAAGYYPVQTISNLMVTELYYNPPMSGGVDGEEFEFLELRNTGPDPLDVGGATFTAGIAFTFTNGTIIAPGSFFVLARNAAQFSARFPGVPIDGLYSGKLANGGETLAMIHPLGTGIFSFAFNNQPPWPTSAAGTGDSLHRIYLGNPTNAANWCAAPPTPGAIGPASCVDTDLDGLPDAWELAHDLDPEDPSGDNGATGDPDHDGVANVQEFIAGTDPRNAQSYLRITNISAVAGVTLAFEAISNKTYTVLYQESLGSAVWQTLTNIPPLPASSLQTIVDAPAGTNRFYRLVTPQHP